MIDPGIFVSGGLSDPLDVGESLNDELVGVDDAEYRQVGTTASEEERWATTLFKDALELRVVSIEVKNT